jgi:hypothetical protein
MTTTTTKRSLWTLFALAPASFVAYLVIDHLSLTGIQLMAFVNPLGRSRLKHFTLDSTNLTENLQVFILVPSRIFQFRIAIFYANHIP